jgi:hypothetical protein
MLRILLITERLVLEKDEADLEVAEEVAVVEMKRRMMSQEIDHPTHTKQVELVEEMRKKNQRLPQLHNRLLRLKLPNQHPQLLNQHQNLLLSLLKKHQSQHLSLSRKNPHLHQLKKKSQQW